MPTASIAWRGLCTLLDRQACDPPYGPRCKLMSGAELSELEIAETRVTRRGEDVSAELSK